MRAVAKGLVTVAICVRNGEQYIAEAIESAKNQSHSPHQILVIDDGSTDGSAAIAAEANCAVVRQGQMGLAVARNTAFNNTSSEWIYFLDADDLMAKNALMNLVAAARNSTSASGAIGLRRNFISPELTNTIRLVDSKFLDNERNSISPGSLWRTELRQTLQFNEKSRVSDVEWMIEFRNREFTVAEIEEVVYFRRIHLNNSSSQQENRRGYLDLAIKNLKRGL
jgi:glycosyltransferase involved in cell wall biosynthesis